MIEPVNPIPEEGEPWYPSREEAERLPEPLRSHVRDLERLQPLPDAPAEAEAQMDGLEPGLQERLGRYLHDLTTNSPKEWVRDAEEMRERIEYLEGREGG